MSAGYAERLKEYPNKGKCGLPENYDTARSLSSKIRSLAQLMNQSSYTVVLTGAGISTSAGIPDFRGPNGIWTREQERLKLRKRKRVEGGNNNIEVQKNNDVEQSTANNKNNDKGSSPSFVTAQPTLTHRALAHLITNDRPSSSNTTKTTTTKHYLNHIITQNIDGLHGKTPLPRNQLSILHGDIFTEKCPICHTEYIRNYEISTIGLQPTGRHCEAKNCNGALIDTLLDWEDALPEKDWEKSQIECARAELILCLGTSLRIEPAGGLCRLGTGVGFVEASADEWDLGDGVSGNGAEEMKQSAKKMTKKKKGRKKKVPQPKKLGYVIVNLQETPYDDTAALVIRAKVDDVMERLMFQLGYDNDWDRGNDDEAETEGGVKEKNEAD